MLERHTLAWFGIEAQDRPKHLLVCLDLPCAGMDGPDVDASGDAHGRGRQCDRRERPTALLNGNADPATALPESRHELCDALTRARRWHREQGQGEQRKKGEWSHDPRTESDAWEIQLVAT